ncbi:hypothetical protein [Arthrobacter psychrolactophilus]
MSLGFMVIFTAWSFMPWWMPRYSEDMWLLLSLARYLVPLLLCVVSLIFLIVPAPAPGPIGTAALAPRTLMTFTSRARLSAVAVVVIVAVVLAILAGLASSPDENGRHVVYQVQTSSNSSASTTIYGWWFSVPCLIVLAVIVMTVIVGLRVISRPALATDRSADSAMMTVRVRNILMVSAGGVLLHVSSILRSLFSTSSLRVGMTAGPAGWIDLGTSFAAIGPALQLAASLAYFIGIGMWGFVFLSTLPIGTRAAHKSAVA